MTKFFLKATAKLRQGFSIHPDHRFVIASHNQEGRGMDGIQSVAGEIRSTPSRDDRAHRILQFSRGNERGRRPGAGPEIA